ncbi:HepT-like ribonuclease domain-containing protein [Bacteroides sp.]
MLDKKRVLSALERIEDAISLVLDKTKYIHSSDDFLTTPDGMFTLSGVCMQLIFIGENVKVIDNKTDHEYLKKYPDIPWTEIMGLRDIIAHEYHRIDAEEIYQVIKQDLPMLLSVIHRMKTQL